MLIDGKWNITVNSPMGAQKSDFTFAASGNSLTGTQAAPQGDVAIKDGSVDGDTATWAVDIKSPMPMTLTFSGTVTGDVISGNVKAGNFGSFTFSGARA